MVWLQASRLSRLFEEANEMTNPNEKPSEEKNSPVRADKGISKAHKGKKKGNESIGRRIRSLERLLKKIGDDMAPGTKRTKEQELASLRALRTERARRANEAAMAKQYRMVKFFERKKIERRLKQLDGKEDTESTKQRKQLVLDLRYVDEYPRDTKYIALFPSKGHTPESLKQVEDIRKRIDAALHSSPDDDSKIAVDASATRDTEGNNAEDNFFLAED